MDLKKILVISDSSPPIQGLAGEISALCNNDAFPGYAVSTVEAENFTGDMLLPAHVFFIGCELPKPNSFIYIEDLFEHICLAGRPCGIFSTNAKALKYLAGLLRSSEASLGIPFLAQNKTHGNGALKKWVQGILKADKNV